MSLRNLSSPHFSDLPASEPRPPGVSAAAANAVAYACVGHGGPRGSRQQEIDNMQHKSLRAAAIGAALLAAMESNSIVRGAR